MQALDTFVQYYIEIVWVADSPNAYSIVYFFKIRAAMQIVFCNRKMGS